MDDDYGDYGLTGDVMVFELKLKLLCVFPVLCDVQIQITAILQLIREYSKRNATASSVSSLEDDNDGNLW